MNNNYVTKHDLTAALEVAVKEIKEYVDSSETRLKEYVDSSETRVKEYVDQRTYEAETRLLRAFSDFFFLRFESLETEPEA